MDTLKDNEFLPIFYMFPLTFNGVGMVVDSIEGILMDTVNLGNI